MRLSTRRSFVSLDCRQRLRLEVLEDRSTPSAYVPNELLVQFAPTAAGELRVDARSIIGASLVEEIHTSAMQYTGQGVLERMRLPDGLNIEDAISIVAALPGVEYAEPNWIYTPSYVSNDPYYTAGGTSLWGMYSDDLPSAIGPAGTTNVYGTQVEKVWDEGYIGSNNIYVGIIDEGFQYSHPDLDANSWTNPFDPIDGIDNDGNGKIDDIHGWDFFNNDNSTYDGVIDDHGTHVAGTIGAEGGNATGVVGVNWKVTMISAKFLEGSGTTANAIRAIDYLTDLKQRHGLNIVATNNSWGGGGPSTGLHAAINRAAKAGILFVAAAGNANANNDLTPNYPSNYSTLVAAGSESAASYEAVIAVASITNTGARSSFSSYGATTVDIGAPGSGINSTVPVNSYASYSGTSMATPHVTGAAALYASKFAGATAEQIRNAILNSATATASLNGRTVTGGRLNIYAALQSPADAPPVIDDADLTLTPSPVNEGTAVTLSGSFTDPNPGETHNVLINWGDGNSDTLNLAAGKFSFSKAHIYADNKPADAPYSITVTVTDSTNLQDSANASIVVRNVAPAPTIGGAPANSPEGTTINLTANENDPGGANDAPFTYLWSVTKNGNAYDPGTPTNQKTFSFTPDDNGTFRVSLTVTDREGASGNTTTNINVTNVAPSNISINGAPTGAIGEGTPVNLSLASFTDPGSADTHLYTWSVTKDGNFYNPGTPYDQTTFSFTPNDNGLFVVSLKITDDDGGNGFSTPISITVTNVAPSNVVITGAPANSNEGATLNLSHTKTDPGSADTFSYFWSVTKDGNAYDPGTPTDQATFSFTPDDNATFIVFLTVVDDDGDSGSATPATITVANVAPTANFTNDGPTGVDKPVTISFLSPTDASPIDLNAGFRYSFDLNNDGDFNDFGELQDVAQTSVVTEFGALGTFTVRGLIRDKDGGKRELFTDVVINTSGNNGVVSVRTYAAAKDAGDDPLVRVFNANGTDRFALFAYDYMFTGGVRVATGDVNGDGIEDLITAPGAGGGPHIKVFSGADGAVLKSFFAFASNFTGGLWVAAADVNGDHFDDIIVGMGAGGSPGVRVFSGRKSNLLLHSFTAYDARFRGGVTVAGGDVNGDGFAEIITGPGATPPRTFAQNPTVKVFNGGSGFVPTLMKQFLAFESFFTNGLTVAAGDVNKDGKADIVVGTMARPGYLSKIRVVSGASVPTATLKNLWSFVAVPNYSGGVRVAVADLDGDGCSDIIYSYTVNRQPGKVTALNGKTLVKLQAYVPFDPQFLGGIFVG